MVKKRMQELGVKIITGVNPTSRSGNTITLSNGQQVDAEVILVATGLSPYTQQLGLENTKVALNDKGFITVDNKMQTSDPNILAVGDVIGEPLLAHKAIRQGVVAAAEHRPGARRGQQRQCRTRR